MSDLEQFELKRYELEVTFCEPNPLTLYYLTRDRRHLAEWHRRFPGIHHQRMAINGHEYRRRRRTR